MTTGDEGEAITVTWGMETFSPVQYHSFQVGPFCRTTTIRKGETFDQAHGRVLSELEEVARAEFKVKLGEHLNRVREAAKQARAR